MVKNTIHLIAWNENEFLIIFLRYLWLIIISWKINIFFNESELRL